MKQLNSAGVSLEDLKLLGTADYSNEDLLEDEDNKALMEKYISEFIRADLITQQPHRRRGTELVNSENQNYIDGGIYIYRTTKEATITEDEFDNGNYEEENVEVTDKNYKQMTYVSKEEFDEMVTNNDGDGIRYKYTIDEDTDELLVAQITTTTILDVDLSNTINSWIGGLEEWLSEYKLAGTYLAGETTHEVEVIRIPYIEYISKYIMPYEFLINLCQITQNPEFVYHVALLARDTEIILAIQDNTTIYRETVETEEDRLYYKNTSSSSTSGATTSDPTPKTKKTRKTTTITTQTPTLKVEYADTWSFYEEFEYTKNISGTLTEEGPVVEKPEIPSTLSGYQPERTELSYDIADGAYEGVPVEVTRSEYWYDTFVTEIRTTTQVITTETTYNEPILKNSVEKSKQFLGLLRNSTGECPYDCSQEDTYTRYDPIALYCSQEAEFDREGTDVKYLIPNSTKMEAPMDNLLSGLELLYATLLSNGSSYTADDLLDDSLEAQNQYIADEDYESTYVSKMQGLVEHLRYLMTFPDEDEYTIKDLILEILEDFFNDEDDTEDEDIIVDEGTIASAREIYEFLIGKGFTPESACAILGNIQKESSFNTGAYNKAHYGLCQWGDSRWEGLKNFASQRGTDWTDLNTQLEYLWYELCGTMADVKNAIINSTDMEDATDIFCRKFEICGNYGIEVPKRYEYAKFWYSVFVEGEDSDNLTTLQSSLLSILNNLSSYSGIENSDGSCQAFVRTVFEKLGVSGDTGGRPSTASLAELKWSVSSDMSNIPVGATVYGKGTSEFGHVGIYIGNGMVVHNIGSSNNCYYGGLKGIKCESISSWDKKYTFTSWGWQGGVDLST